MPLDLRKRLDDVLINQIEAALIHGLPDMSLHNCHAVGVDSIVLACTEGQCRRVFVAWSDVHGLDNLYRPDGHFQVGVHNHKYDLVIHPVHGTLINYEVVLRHDNLDWGPILWEHDFTSGITGELSIGPGRKRVVDRHDTIALHPTDLSRGWLYRALQAQNLHTVIVPKQHEYTAWMVTEGKHYNQSLFYSPIPEPADLAPDLYQPMSVLDATVVLERILSDA